MAKPRDLDPNRIEGGQQRSAKPGPHGDAHVTGIPTKSGLRPIHFPKWVFNYSI
jgi:hypothetical protein